MIKRSLTALLALGLPLTAMGQGISYNYADVRYGDADGGLDGVVGEVSGQVADQFFLRGGVSLLSNSGVDLDTFTGEFGLRHALNRDVELQGTLGLIHADIDTPGSSSDDTGLLATGGIRAMVAPQFEVEGTLIYEDNDVLDDGLDARFGGLFHFTPRLAAGASYRVDNELLTIGGRYDFGIQR